MSVPYTETFVRHALSGGRGLGPDRIRFARRVAPGEWSVLTESQTNEVSLGQVRSRTERSEVSVLTEI